MDSMTLALPTPSFDTVYQAYSTWIYYNLILYGQEHTLELIRIQNDAMQQLLAYYVLLMPELAYQPSPLLTFDHSALAARASNLAWSLVRTIAAMARSVLVCLGVARLSRSRCPEWPFLYLLLRMSAPPPRWPAGCRH